MSKSTNVSVSMSPSCARAWRRLERSFTGDEAMLPVMVRGLADAWDESARPRSARRRMRWTLNRVPSARHRAASMKDATGNSTSVPTKRYSRYRLQRPRYQIRLFSSVSR